MQFSLAIPSAGATLRAEVLGQGPALILLHAGVTDRRMWQSTQSSLARSYQTIAYDRRGFGETLTPDEPFSHVGDLGRVIAHFDCRRPILIGCSQGGRIAIDYTLAHPGKVAALVLIATALSGAPQPEAYPTAIAALMAELESAEEAGDVDRVNAIEARLWLDGPLTDENRVTGPARRLFLDMNGKALRHPPLTKEQPSSSAIDRLRNIAVPALVIWGDLDFPHIQQRSHWIGDAIAGAKRLTMRGCAHLPNLEQPEIFETAIADFLVSGQNSTLA